MEHPWLKDEINNPSTMGKEWPCIEELGGPEDFVSKGLDAERNQSSIWVKNLLDREHVQGSH